MIVKRACLFASIAAMMGVLGWPGQAAECLGKSEFQKQRAFSPAVISRGGKVV